MTPPLRTPSGHLAAVRAAEPQPSDGAPTKPETPPARKASGQFKAVREALDQGRRDAGLDSEPPDTLPDYDPSEELEDIT